MDGKTGLSAAINMAAVCENELGMIVLGVGSLPEPGANPTLDCAVELAGEHLLYSIALKRTGVYLAAAPLDGDGVLETIVRFNDTANDWATPAAFGRRVGTERDPKLASAAAGSWLWPWLRQLDYRIDPPPPPPPTARAARAVWAVWAVCCWRSSRACHVRASLADWG